MKRSGVPAALTLILLLLCAVGPASPQSAETNEISPLAIQSPAHELLDYQGFVRRLGELAKSPRVRIEEIGRTWQGRSIFLIVVADASVIAELESHRLRAVRISQPEISYRSLNQFQIGKKETAQLVEQTPLPVLFAGASWGHEAAQVEGLLKAAGTLAFEDSEEVRQALSHGIGLFIPLMNPDGREAALSEWKKEPLARGNSGVGNAYGFMLNRDFIHATQPESQAIVEASLGWRPVAAIDQHEDMYHLGVALPEVCFVEPFAAGFDKEEHPLTRRAIVSLGGAIAAKWRSLGFRALYNPEGDNTFAPLPPAGEGISPVAGSAGRLNLMWSLHGIAGFITESARSPGSQSWRDRVDQKASAALAALQEVSRDPVRYAGAVYERKLEEMRQAGAEFLVIPEESGSQGALVEMLRILKLHQILLFRVNDPYASLVVPLNQPEGTMAWHLLVGARSRLNLLGPSLGLKVVSSGELGRAERSRFEKAALLPATLQAPQTEVSGDRSWRVEPTLEGFRLVNALLASGQGEVKRNKNSFAVRASRGFLQLKAGLYQVPLTPILQFPPDRPPPMSLPRAGVYAGQGVDEANWGEIVWALEQAQFPWRILDEVSLPEGLKRIDALIVPSGSAPEIVNGWKDEPTGPRQHWKLPVKPQGIGKNGLDAIRNWVNAGGTYIGIGSGGNLLAGKGMLSLTDAEMPDSRVGIGIVRLRIDRPDSPLFFGFSLGPLLAFLDAPPGEPRGGFVFRGGSAVKIASYAGVDTVEAERSFLSAEPFSPDDTAILMEAKGKGKVILLGVNPAFRGQWRNTFRLLYNAVYLSVE